MFDPSSMKNAMMSRFGKHAQGANAGQTLNAPTSPFARFRSKVQSGPRPGLPSVIGNLFQGSATDQPPVASEGAGMMPGGLAGLMQKGGLAGAGTPMPNGTPDAASPFAGGLAGMMQQGGSGGLADFIAQMRARQQQPPMPPMPSPIAPTPPSQSPGNY